jgi:hypothetical protein
MEYEQNQTELALRTLRQENKRLKGLLIIIIFLASAA